MTMKEAHVEHHLVKRAKAEGGEVRKLRWIGRKSAPDRFLSLPHAAKSMWLVELKRPGEDLRDDQAREHRRLRDAGCNVVMLNSIQAVDDFFDRLKTGGV